MVSIVATSGFGEDFHQRSARFRGIDAEVLYDRLTAGEGDGDEHDSSADDGDHRGLFPVHEERGDVDAGDHEAGDEAALLLRFRVLNFARSVDVVLLRCFSHCSVDDYELPNSGLGLPFYEPFRVHEIL